MSKTSRYESGPKGFWDDADFDSNFFDRGHFESSDAFRDVSQPASPQMIKDTTRVTFQRKTLNMPLVTQLKVTRDTMKTTKLKMTEDTEENNTTNKVSLFIRCSIFILIVLK